MARSASSRTWLREHENDPFVLRARREGYRARAAYKLLEIDDRDRLLRPGALVVDLGAAPGSWSQVAAARVGARGRVVAVDLLPVDPVPGVEVVQGDFTDAAVADRVAAALGGRPADLVLSDMAPNISGIASADQARAMHLAELALEFAIEHLGPGGAFLVKVFQGAGFPEFRAGMLRRFASLATRKPAASRGRSTEVYLLGRGPRTAS